MRLRNTHRLAHFWISTHPRFPVQHREGSKPTQFNAHTIGQRSRHHLQEVVDHQFNIVYLDGGCFAVMAVISSDLVMVVR
jgi:hypothetical protein